MADDLVSRKNFMLLGLSVATVGVLEAACTVEDEGPTDDASGGSSSKGGGTGSGGASSGGAAQGGTSGGSGGALSSGGTAGSGGGAACLAVAIEISCNHEHVLTIPVEDVMAGTEKPYTLSNNGTHDHDITLTSAQFATLRAGGSVHMYLESIVQPHCLTITCGVASEPTPAECAEDSMVCLP